MIVPIFALANSGLGVSAEGFRDAAGSAVTWGVFLGMVVGKPLGILVSTRVAIRSGLADKPPGVTTRHVLGAGSAGRYRIHRGSVHYRVGPLQRCRSGEREIGDFAGLGGLRVVVDHPADGTVGEIERRRRSVTLVRQGRRDVYSRGQLKCGTCNQFILGDWS